MRGKQSYQTDSDSEAEEQEADDNDGMEVTTMSAPPFEKGQLNYYVFRLKFHSYRLSNLFKIGLVLSLHLSGIKFL